MTFKNYIRLTGRGFGIDSFFLFFVFFSPTFLFLSHLASEDRIPKPQRITEWQLICTGFYYMSSTKTRTFTYLFDEVLGCKPQNPLQVVKITGDFK